MLKEWTRRIDDQTRLFTQTFEDMGPETLNRKPSPDSWSIAQNLEHLIMINDTYGDVFENLISGELKLPFYSRIRFISDLLGKLILDAVEPERTKKTKTFEIWKPVQSRVPENIMNRFVQSQENLKDQLNRLEPFIREDVIIHTPINDKIILPLNMAIGIIITHQLRHFNQCKEIQGLIESGQAA